MAKARADGTAPARVLARRRADAAAHGGEGIGRAGDEVRVLVPPLRDQLDVPPGVGGHRTTGLALDLVLPMGQVGQADTYGHRPLPATRTRKHSRDESQPICL